MCILTENKNINALIIAHITVWIVFGIVYLVISFLTWEWMTLDWTGFRILELVTFLLALGIRTHPDY
jgi:hypothetical protein